MRRSCYVRGSVVAFQEDARHEFKGHRNLTVEEVPALFFAPSGRATRQPISRTLNGFLNSGKGGTVYLGVLDDGTVKGFPLTEAQKDHIKLSLDDLMNRFEPPVPTSMYRLEFVPLVVDGEPPAPTLNSSTGSSTHLLRSFYQCWCDVDASRFYKEDVSIPEYVVEVSICQSVVPSSSSGKLELQLIYQNEEGLCFFRRNSSVQCYSHQEVVEYTVQQVREHYDKEVERLRNKMVAYQLLLKTNLKTAA